jgi:hypothetical protein
MTSASAMKNRRRPATKTAERPESSVPKLDSDAFQLKARNLVLDGFNSHRNPEKDPELLMGEINVVWFAKVLGGWKCIVSSTVAKGLLWEITYASFKDEIYMDVYRKVSNKMISLADPQAA